jgi:hypothetical protein
MARLAVKRLRAKTENRTEHNQCNIRNRFFHGVNASRDKHMEERGKVKGPMDAIWS